MIIKKIKEDIYENFVTKSEYSSFYQSLEWYRLKCKENKKCELLGLYENDTLVGVSLVVYLKILRKYYMAYASSGFIYDYQNIADFKDALITYFKDKNVIFFRMDPLVVLATYDKDLNKNVIDESNRLICELKNNGFKHYGFNLGFETMQFRFVHTLEVESNFEEQMTLMGKSTRKNIILAHDMGVRIKRGSIDFLDKAYNLFESTIDRKKIGGFSKQFYADLINEFKNNITIYIAYIEKSELIKNLEEKIKENDIKFADLKKKMETSNVGAKLKKQEEILNNQKKKLEVELSDAKNLEDYTEIASMLSIFKYDEVVSFVSGMDNKYRKFCPKYAMYPAMINDAINKKIKTVNFLGVKNILDENDKDYGVYEVKRGFGGKTLEYIGEFDLPIKKGLYKIYKLKENHDRGRK